jgi:hypothetical protein
MKTKQILDTSDEAACYGKNLEGWIDRHGRFWGKDEKAARWSGCTHIICPECGRPTPKHYTICQGCREKKAIERYKLKERRHWDLTVPVYSETTDEYFFDANDLNDWLEDHNCTAESLRLVICEPIYLRQVNEDYFCDELPEDEGVPDDIADALENLNRIIREQGPISWDPGKYAAIL